MKEEKSAAHTRAEGKLAVLVSAVFVIWCPTYLIIVRPWINSSIAGYVSSYPAMLHLIPILGLWCFSPG